MGPHVLVYSIRLAAWTFGGVVEKNVTRTRHTPRRLPALNQRTMYAVITDSSTPLKVA